ncbi:unnamed protein product [Ixodes persulcatus]
MFQMSRDVWRQLDIIMYFLVVTEFVLTSLVSVQSANPNRFYVMFLQFSFITLISCRIIKTLQKRSVLFVWIWDLLDGILNRKLFYAYDLSWAYITAEDEAMVKVSRFVQTQHLALMIRANSGNNKLQNLSWMIQKADGMPTNIVVGNAPFYTMLSVPWLPSEDVSKLLRVSQGKTCEFYKIKIESNLTLICIFVVFLVLVNSDTIYNTDRYRNVEVAMYQGTLF